VAKETGKHLSGIPNECQTSQDLNIALSGFFAILSIDFPSLSADYHFFSVQNIYRPTALLIKSAFGI
jgi:hypothetical protein